MSDGLESLERIFKNSWQIKFFDCIYSTPENMEVFPFVVLVSKKPDYTAKNNVVEWCAKNIGCHYHNNLQVDLEDIKKLGFYEIGNNWPPVTHYHNFWKLEGQ